MAEIENGKAEAAAEKAYTEALDTMVPAKPAPVAKPVAAEPAPVVSVPVAPVMVIPSVMPKAAQKLAKAPKAKPATKQVAKSAAKREPSLVSKVAKPSKPAAKPASSATGKAKKPASKVPVATAVPTASAKKIIPPAKTAIAISKEKAMTIKTKITEGFETVIGEAQTKAKEAFEKSSAVLGDYAEFAKGNVEAVVESGKILAEGLQDMGTNLVAESRATFETVSSDIKEMAAAKSPTDLIQLQSEMLRKSFDSAMAYGSKNTEAMIKIAGDAIAPISSRVSIAVEKVRQTAA